MISIVIPSFNEEENIESCLLSLTKQTIPRNSYEIIVVDGGSKDKTRQIAEQYADLVFIQESPRVGGHATTGYREPGVILLPRPMPIPSFRLTGWRRCNESLQIQM